MMTDKPLLLSAILGNIEVEGNFEDGLRSQHFVQLYVDDKKVAKSTKKAASPVLKWEWIVDNQIWFEPSSMMKVVIYRGFGVDIKLTKHLVGQYEGKVVDLLENNASFDLADKKGIHIPVKMKIALTPVPQSDDYIKEFMERLDDDVARLPSLDAVLGIGSTLVEVLKFTKTIMDQFSKAHPILNASWTVVSTLYQVIQETAVQDESIRNLVSTLREMLGAANEVPDLLAIPNTTNVLEDISRQSLQVALLIHEYTKLPWAARTAKIQLPEGLKTRIDRCQKSCAALQVKFYNRVHLDTNAQVHEIRHNLMDIGNTLDVIKDDTLVDKIHKWLSPPDSSRNRNEADEKRQEDTCSWFLEGERFLEWHAKPGFLWVHGKPGCGKSVLCSSILNKLSENHPTFGVAYFFFDGRDSQNAFQHHDKLVRSLISQFSYQRGGIPAELADLYKRFGDHQQPSVNQLQTVLRDILNGFSHAYIVIDALDECTDREKTLIWVNKLVSDEDQTAEKLHIMVISRPEEDIGKVFKTLDRHSVDIGEAAANLDILKYLELHMESKFEKYSEITRKKIGCRLREHAEGSFRWVALQLAELEGCSSEYQIMQQLENLPEGLDDIYKRILRAIDRKYCADMMTFLQWLAFCRRPMTIAEVAEAITVDFSLEV